MSNDHAELQGAIVNRKGGEESSTVASRKIRLLDIRKKLLTKHEELGIVRENTNNYINSLSESNVKERLMVFPK